MFRHFLLRFDELVLKHRNRGDFSKYLYQNLLSKLKNIECQITKGYDGFWGKCKSDNFEKVKKLTKEVFGFKFFIEIHRIENIEINNIADSIAQKFTSIKDCSFKIEVRRFWKNYKFNSLEISRFIGSKFLSVNSSWKVNLSNPDHVITILWKKEECIYYWEKIALLGGLPTGINGRVLSLISGGIDSPVASFLMMKRGYDVDYLTFISEPNKNSKSVDKIIEIKNILNKFSRRKSQLFVCNISKLEHEISHLSNERYRIIVLKRCFVKIANFLAVQNKNKALVTGDALNQVASQTLEGIEMINEASDKLILRPLLTYEKAQIIKIAKEIKTYKISILPHPDTCANLNPKNPIIKPKLRETLYNEKKVELLGNLIEYVSSKEIFSK